MATKKRKSAPKARKPSTRKKSTRAKREPELTLWDHLQDDEF